MFLIFDNVISKQMCDELISIGPDPKNVKCITPFDSAWSDRVVNITNHPVVSFVKDFMLQTVSLTLTPIDVQIQLWPAGSKSGRHIHNVFNREQFKYTSMLYLNNDFEGGEFFTDDIIVKPLPGRLTYFDGSKTYHGVNQVQMRDRFTVIFWWC